MSAWKEFSPVPVVQKALFIGQILSEFNRVKTKFVKLNICICRTAYTCVVCFLESGLY